MRARPGRHSGFTLLELLVVLVLLGLAAAVATPAMLRLADAAEGKTARDQVRQYMHRFPVVAMHRGQSLTLPATTGYRSGQWLSEHTGTALPELLSDAQFALEEPITYRSNGACTGGTVHWRVDDRELTFHLEAPLCLPEPEA